VLIEKKTSFDVMSKEGFSMSTLLYVRGIKL
jgi:hypothetical protein